MLATIISNPKRVFIFSCLSVMGNLGIIRTMRNNVIKKLNKDFIQIWTFVALKRYFVEN